MPPGCTRALAIFARAQPFSVGIPVVALLPALIGAEASRRVRTSRGKMRHLIFFSLRHLVLQCRECSEGGGRSRLRWRLLYWSCSGPFHNVCHRSWWRLTHQQLGASLGGEADRSGRGRAARGARRRRRASSRCYGRTTFRGMQRSEPGMSARRCSSTRAASAWGCRW